VGVLITIQIGESSKTVKVLGVSAVRRPAKEAVFLYEETIESVAMREKYARIPLDGSMQSPRKRPDKKARKLLQQVKKGGWLDF